LRRVGKTFPQQLISIDTEELISGRDECIALILNRAKALKTRHILLLLHGYNNSFADAIARARALADDIQFKGLVVVWSWPSQGEWSTYPDDEKAVGWSTDHFIDFIAALMAAAPNALDVDFVAHSMGSRILVAMARSLRTALVFAAPDVDNDKFSQGMSPRYFQTLYSSANDVLLQVSAKFHDGPRAGSHHENGIPLITSGVESIDAILSGHSYVYEDPRALRDFHRHQPAASSLENSLAFCVNSSRSWGLANCRPDRGDRRPRCPDRHQCC
jgi:esterase/lipase superfamily enzyme